MPALCCAPNAAKTPLLGLQAWRPHSWLTPIPEQEYYFFGGCVVSFCGVFLIAAKPRYAATERRGGGTVVGSAATSTPVAAEDEQLMRRESIARDSTFSSMTAQLSDALSALASSSAAGLLHESARSNSVGAQPDSPPLATADLRGSVNVVTGVGTMQHLYCAFGSRRSPDDREPLGDLVIDPAASVPCQQTDALSASLIRNDHSG